MTELKGLVKEIPQGLDLNTLEAHSLSDQVKNPDQYRIKFADIIEGPEPLLAIMDGRLRKRV